MADGINRFLLQRVFGFPFGVGFGAYSATIFFVRAPTILTVLLSILRAVRFLMFPAALPVFRGIRLAIYLNARLALVEVAVSHALILIEFGQRFRSVTFFTGLHIASLLVVFVDCSIAGLLAAPDFYLGLCCYHHPFQSFLIFDRYS
ncbi:MAG: hypothetical protein GY819_19390 [Planctomycetaceae bacterium]|nr:hypothetical protein [Planctomycetaceae bacterium]